ncbi:MAG: anti-sigma factor domain-containing protein [Xanthobacteraceae bacterium]
MFEEDQETLAAEYVLGTLSAEEREHAEALRSFDPEFDAAVRQWERRLGELNVMVEAVEPPAEVWDKIKKEVSPEAAAAADAASSETAAEAEGPRDLDSPGTTDVVAGDFLFLEPSTQPAEVSEEPAEASEEPAETPADDLAVPPPLAARQGGVPRSADIVVLRRRVRRWRGFTIGLGAIAALLAAYIAVSQVAPDLIPPQLRAVGAGLMARIEPPVRGPQDRLVAVLQQQPTAPAFLLTVDTRQRTLFVRRVSAGLETDRSYELWLIAGRSSAPRSLGVVGSDEFTQRPLPANIDLDTLRAATYAVSLEPAGGSPSGAPTGPVLFTGKAVESLPASPQPAPKT